MVFRLFHGQVGLLGGLGPRRMRAAAQREGSRLARGAALCGGSLRNAPEHLQVGTGDRDDIDSCIDR